MCCDGPSMYSSAHASSPASASIRPQPISRRHAWPRRQRASSSDRPCGPRSRRSSNTCRHAKIPASTASAPTSTPPDTIWFHCTGPLQGEAGGRERAGQPRPYFTRLHPHAQHAGHLLQAVAGAVLGHVGQSVPVRIAEVDDVDRRDAGLVQRDVVVLDGEAAELVGRKAVQCRSSAVFHRSRTRSPAFQNEFCSMGNFAFLPPTMSSSTAPTYWTLSLLLR